MRRYPFALRKIIDQTAEFRRAPPDLGYNILVEMQMPSELWEAGEIPIQSKSKFLKKISEIKEAIHQGSKLNDLLHRFRKVCSKYPIPIQGCVDAVGFVRIEAGAARHTVSSKTSSTLLDKKTRHIALRLRSPSSETPNTNKDNDESSDDESSDDDKDDPIYDFSIVEQLPLKVVEAEAAGEVHQPSPEELTAIDDVKLLCLTGKTAFTFDNWKDKILKAT